MYSNALSKISNNNIPKSSITKKAQTTTYLPKSETSPKTITFSFSKFCCKSIKSRSINFNNCFKNMWEYAEWSLKLIYRLSEFSKYTPIELKTGGDSTRCHPVRGKRLEKLKNILNELGVVTSIEDDQIMEDGYYELSLGASEGRIFGYFCGNIYFITLFDPHHLLYEQLEYGCQYDLYYKNYDPWLELHRSSN